MILLDTHALVWCATGDTTKMSGARMDQIDAAIIEGQAAVSAVTFWELELLRRKPDNSSLRLPPTANLRLRLLSDGLREIAPTGDLMVRAVQLGDEGFHKDPMDRIIVATALQGGLRLATADAQIIDWANHTGHLELFDLRHSAPRQ
ncbi:type II toxin-antitoxin system VapC family toxin [Candidatus Poriferisocius sp.]|uniref:type II toxin-antitoxin system VapC family toxin n=1 Tax=Candidatus Poriferisocius sp. TaxID=3101276 RepID=UPI003B016B71